MPTDTPAAAVPSRRAFLVGVAAASSPSFATAAVAVPVPVVEPSASAENPELVTTGHEIDIAVERYERAREAKASARQRAEDLWPATPVDLVLTHRTPWIGGLSAQIAPADVDVMGAEIQPVRRPDGRYNPPPKVITPTYLREHLGRLLSKGGKSEQFAVELLPRAEAFQAQRQRVLEAAGLPSAMRECREAAGVIFSLADDARDAEALTVQGLLIKAKAMNACAIVELGYHIPGRDRVMAGSSWDLADSVMTVLGGAA